MLGTMCKADPITETQARGRYARIYVEIDISKPLLGSITIDNRTIMVEYESLGLICFKCGKYGHSKDNCREVGGKQFGSGAASKSTGVRAGNRQGRDSKVVNPDILRKANVSKVGGFRFEILSKEMDVMMNENLGQSKMSSEEGSKTKDQGILAEITNQAEEHGEKVFKTSYSSENRSRKKITNKKITKTTDKGGHLKVGSISLRNPRGKGKKKTSLSTHSKNLEDNILDSASVLRQFHKDVSEFKTKYSRGASTDPSTSKCELSNPVNKNISSDDSDNFETVASDLVEAMAVISE
ncbi:hypothetical protein Dsin_021721 [Dipteronia sinensis]|uniref:CCHC-type domain-containing protein n=1 Tax=Dipteronia sinensis TaxID=43782 RepID=A0AAE0A1N4_9ROSI|nr:hypothetical protein Dsin_021721 [Dipteronia sinensis]